MNLQNMKVTSVNLITELVTVSIPVDLSQRSLIQLADQLLQMNQTLQGAGYTNLQVTNYEDEPLSISAQRAATHSELTLGREKSEKNMRYCFENLVSDLEYDVESYAKGLTQTAEELPKLEAKSKDPGISAGKRQEALKLIEFIKAGLPKREQKYQAVQTELAQVNQVKSQGATAVYSYMRQRALNFHEVEF